MADPTPSIPRLYHHRGRDRGFVKVGGRFVYFAKWGTAECQREYHSWCSAFVKAGYQLPEDWAGERRIVRRLPEDEEPMGTCVAELVEQYLDDLDQTYGPRSNQWYVTRTLARPLVRLFGALPAADIGPAWLIRIRDELMREGYARTTITKIHSRYVALVKWAVVRELVPADNLVRVEAVPGLRAGQPGVRETQPVAAVSDEAIRKIRPHVSSVVWAMVQMQRLTGARSGEIVGLTPGDIDRSGEVWRVTLSKHETAHRGHVRRIFIGPKLQRILASLLVRDDEQPIFDPRESYAELRAREAAGKRRNHEATPRKPGGGSLPHAASVPVLRSGRQR